MKYTVTIIDTEEKFIDRFGKDPQWTISTPLGRKITVQHDRQKVASKTKEIKGKVSSDLTEQMPCSPVKKA